MTKSKLTAEPLTPNKWLELAETHDDDRLRQVLTLEHPADIAQVTEHLPLDLQVHLVKLLDEEKIAEIAAELDSNTLGRLIRRLQPHDVAGIVLALDSDDAADLLGSIDDSHSHDILGLLPDDRRNTLEELLSYDEESAGGIMAKEALAVPLTFTVQQVIERLRDLADELDDIYNVYITDDSGKLQGMTSLRYLILAQPDQLVNSVMESDLPMIPVGLDREEVAGIFSKYNLVSAPVVDKEGIFLGRILHDDILDVLEEEVHEDIAHLTGHADFDPGDRSIWRNLNSRLPWLMLGLLGGFVSATILAYFQPQFERFTALIFFLPLVAAMGGSAGIQTSALMVRGIATGDIGRYRLINRILGEVGLAILLGLACSIVLYIFIIIWRNDLQLAYVVSSSLIIVIFISSLVGVLVPLGLRRIGLDPALATGPFITTTNDIFGLFIYLGIAALVLY